MTTSKNENKTMDIITVERRRLRRETLAARDRMPEAARRAASLAITANLLQLPELVRAQTIFCFVSFRSEPETLPFIRKCLSQGKRVAVPRTLPGKGLEAFLVRVPEAELAPGYCGIPEPIPNKSELIKPSSIDLVVLPGSVFDPQGGRLGYGGGYYDRFCAHEAPQAFRVAIAFEFQVIPCVPVMPHDESVHALVTEGRILRVKSFDR